MFPGLASPISIAGGHLNGARELYPSCSGDSPHSRRAVCLRQPLYNCAAAACTPALDATANRLTVPATQSTSHPTANGGRPPLLTPRMVSYAGIWVSRADVSAISTLGPADASSSLPSFGIPPSEKLQARMEVIDCLAVARQKPRHRLPIRLTPGNDVETLSTTSFSVSHDLVQNRHLPRSPSADVQILRGQSAETGGIYRT